TQCTNVASANDRTTIDIAFTSIGNCFCNRSGSNRTEQSAGVAGLHLHLERCFSQLSSLCLCSFETAFLTSFTVCPQLFNFLLRADGPTDSFAARDQVVPSVTIAYFDNVAGRAEARDLLGQNDFLVRHDFSPLISV